MSTFNIIRGETTNLVFTILDSTGAVADLSSITGATLTFRKFAGDTSTPALRLTLGSGLTVASPQSGATKGQLNAVATNVQTATIAAGDWTYDLFINESDGTVRCAIPSTAVPVLDCDLLP